MYSHTHPCNKFHIHIHPDSIDNNSSIANYDLENPIYQVEDEGEEDYEIPGELARLLMKEERAIRPHEEPVEVVNLGTEEQDRKSVV